MIMHPEHTVVKAANEKLVGTHYSAGSDTAACIEIPEEILRLCGGSDCSQEERAQNDRVRRTRSDSAHAAQAHIGAQSLYIYS